MRRLERATAGKPPKGWDAKVKKRLPSSFSARAQEFETSPIASATRRSGFNAFAPAALPPKGFPKLWNDAKDGVTKMSRGNCAYCETKLTSGREGQVEHFKPKAVFPTLAYAWDNYFLACAGCNGAKSDKWPEAGGYVRPDEGEPEKRFRFRKDGSVRTATKDADAAATVRDFDLDRKGLRYARAGQIRDHLADLAALKNEAIPAAVVAALKASKIARCRADWRPFSAAVSAVLARA